MQSYDCQYLKEHPSLDVYYTILYYTILYYTILYYTILYYTILYYTILYYTILYYTILYYTILYYTILYYTILYYTILYYTILYYLRYLKACFDITKVGIQTEWRYHLKPYLRVTRAVGDWHPLRVVLGRVYRGFNWWVSFAPEFQCCYFCESSRLFYLSFNSEFYVSKIMHLWARNLPRKPNN